MLAELRRRGGRVTTARRAVLDALLEHRDHITADELAAAVQQRHPDVHLSTVYRTLEALERIGVVDRVSLGDGGAIYHLVDHVHHHLVCDGCGAVIEIPDEVAGALARQLDRDYGFELSSRHLALAGRCADCR